MSTHHPFVWNCPRCDASAVSQEDAAAHVKIAHPRLDIPIVAPTPNEHPGVTLIRKMAARGGNSQEGVVVHMSMGCAIQLLDNGEMGKHPLAEYYGDGAIEPSYQDRVSGWLLACFGATIARDTNERSYRFLEEALELVQACGMTRAEAHQLVEYTFDRPTGEPAQEVGGVMTTLSSLCYANNLDLDAAAEAELARVLKPEVMERIRAKQAAKPHRSPLPGKAPDETTA